MKDKIGAMEEFMKVLLWVVIFILLGAAVYKIISGVIN